MNDSIKNITLFGNDTSVTLCSHLDANIEELWDMRYNAREELQDPSSLALPITVLCVSIVTLLFGARIFRGTAAITAMVITFTASYTILRDTSEDVACESTIAIAGGLALLAAVVTGCLMNVALFICGAAALAAVVHLVFASFPELHDVGDQPTLAGKSFAYWALIGVSIITGAILVRFHSKLVLDIVTSCIGGAGFAYSLYGINTIALNHDIDQYIFVIVGCVAIMVGVLVQRQQRIHGCNSRP